MSGCNGCGGSCGSCGCGGCGCGGCGGGNTLELSEGEIRMLKTLSQIPFLPVARKMGEDVPVYLEEADYPQEEYTLILQCLEKRGLIDIDYSAPLKGFDMSAYGAYPIRGSFGLTARGQVAAELLEYLGAE